jgi:hypothetical protein
MDGPGELGDDDVVDARHGRALGHEAGELRERLVRAGRLDGPPDLVAAPAARRRRRAVAQRRVMAAERREDGAADVGLVPVVEEEARDDRSVPGGRRGRIGARP